MLRQLQKLVESGLERLKTKGNITAGSMFIWRSKLMALKIKGARVPWDMEAVKGLFIEYQKWLKLDL